MSWTEQGSASSRGYGAAWLRMRRVVLREEPRCRRCGAPARHVDHIIPRSRGGSEERSNLQALCRECHDGKSAYERGDPPQRLPRSRAAEQHPGDVAGRGAV